MQISKIESDNRKIQKKKIERFRLWGDECGLCGMRVCVCVHLFFKPICTNACVSNRSLLRPGMHLFVSVSVDSNWIDWHSDWAIVWFWFRELHSAVAANLIVMNLCRLRWQQQQQHLHPFLAAVSTDRMALNRQHSHRRQRYCAMIWNLVGFLFALEVNVVAAEGIWNYQQQQKLTITIFNIMESGVAFSMYRIWFPIARSRLNFRNGRITGGGSFLSGCFGAVVDVDVIIMVFAVAVVFVVPAFYLENIQTDWRT